MKVEVQINPHRPRIDRCILDEVALEAQRAAYPGWMAVWYKCPQVLVVATIADTPRHIEPMMYHYAEGFMCDIVETLVEKLLDKGFTVKEGTDFNPEWQQEV